MQKNKVLHTLSNRVRLKIPRLRNNQALAMHLEKQAAKADGVLWAQANPACSSVVVRFDPAARTGKDVLDIIDTLASTA